MANDIFNFKGIKIEVLVLNEQILFNPKDVAQCLEIADVNSSIRKFKPNQKVKITNEDLDMHDMHFRKLNNAGEIFLTESGVYKLIFKSHKEEAEEFQDWVCEEVLPTIRQAGCYITEHAQQETIDFQTKFGNRRLRKTFRESTDIESTWLQYKELSKIERDAHRINNKDRIRACDIIVDELSDYIANNTTTMKASKILLYKEVIEEILNTKQLWTNKMYGGIKSNMTVKINNLEQENQELKQQVADLTPPERNWVICPIHGFSENYMYSWSNRGQVARSKAYNRWIDMFPAYEVPTKEEYEYYYGIDFTRDICIEISYICKEAFDVKNFDKATLDMIFNRILGVDDNIVKRVISDKAGICEDYEDGELMFTIYNI